MNTVASFKLPFTVIKLKLAQVEAGSRAAVVQQHWMSQNTQNRGRGGGSRLLLLLREPRGSRAGAGQGEEILEALCLFPVGLVLGAEKLSNFWAPSNPGCSPPRSGGPGNIWDCNVRV